MNSVRRFHNKHSGETCLIIGNGPSLDNTPLEKFDYITFGSNMIYRKPFIPDYYCIVDEEMMRACLPLPREIMYESEKFIRAEACIPSNNPIYPIVAAGFSLDPSNFVVMGGTVTYVLLQLAFYMGFDTALLVGIDHYYPKASQNGRFRFIAKGTDPDHFQPEDGKPYFEEGKLFNPPELDGTTKAYQIAQEVYEKTGKKIINITPNTRLNVFRKETFKAWV